MSTVQASLRCQLTSADRSLTDVVSAMNGLLQRSTSDGGYATFFLAQFDKATRALTYVNAGHNPPMLVRALLAWQREADEFLRAPVPHRFSSNRAVEDAPPVAVSVAEDPTVRLLATGRPISSNFLNGPYEKQTLRIQRGNNLSTHTN